MTTPTQTVPPRPESAPSAAPPAGAERSRGSSAETVAIGAVFFASFALVAAVFAVGLAARAATEARSARDAAVSRPASAAPAAESVGLDEFAIEPGDLTLPAGSAVAVQNNGSVVHNLAVEGLTTPMLDPGGSAELDLGGLGRGSYTMVCTVPGHEAAGMRGTVTVE